MDASKSFKLLLAGVLVLAFTASAAEDSTDDQADVWAVIEKQWNADEKGDKKWPDELLTDDFAGWDKHSPAPRNRSSTKMWDRFNDRISKMVAHELYPLAIVVSDDVAIAHYLYSSAAELKDGEIEMSNGRFTDVLVRTDTGWKFLAWHGGDN